MIATSQNIVVGEYNGILFCGGVGYATRLMIPFDYSQINKNQSTIVTDIFGKQVDRSVIIIDTRPYRLSDKFIYITIPFQTEECIINNNVRKIRADITSLYQLDNNSLKYIADQIIDFLVNTYEMEYLDNKLLGEYSQLRFVYNRLDDRFMNTEGKTKNIRFHYGIVINVRKLTYKIY